MGDGSTAYVLCCICRGETLACVGMLRKDFAPMRDQIDADRLKELDAAIVHADPLYVNCDYIHTVFTESILR